MMKKYLRKSPLQITIVFILFFLTAYYYQPTKLSDSFNAILTISSFLYGFYIVYSVSSAKEHHEKIIEHLKGTEGMLINVYGLMKVFDKKTQADLLKKIDEYLIVSIDYYLPDYSNSTKQAIELMNFIQMLKPISDAQKFAQDDSVETIESMLKERVIIESEIANKITFTEWSILLLLFLVMLFFIFTIDSSGSLLLIFLKTVVATGLFTMLIILYKFNNLTWREDRWLWNRLTITFQQLGLKPYYPENAYRFYYAHKKTNYTYRVAYYPEEYPSMQNKRIEVVEP